MLLQGNEIVGYIKQRQFEQTRSLQHTKQIPQLAIISTGEVVSDKHTDIKQKYGADIGVQVELHQPSINELIQTIHRLNEDTSVHGIVVQLPLPDSIDTETILAEISPKKDIDGLRTGTSYNPPTPTAILWLLGGYDITLEKKTVGVIGQGRLVGKPLVEMLRHSGVDPLICDKNTNNFEEVFARSDIIITATGQPKLITNEYIYPNTTIIDAGTAYHEGVLSGDVDTATYDRDDIKVSPVPGGVGPLTVCALFENLLVGFREQIHE